MSKARVDVESVSWVYLTPVNPEDRDDWTNRALLSVPVVWCGKPYGGLDGHGTSSKGRCEVSPESSEVSSPGKLSVFS